MIALLLASSFLFPVPPKPFAEIKTAWIVDTSLSISGAMGDIITTRMILDRGGVELNPVMRGGDAKRIALKVGLVTLQSWGSYRLRKSGQKRKADILRWALLSVHVGLIAHNVHQVRK